jgi:adenylate cyclase
MPRLVVNGPECRKVVHLPPTGIVVGRDTMGGLDVEDRRVSRRHCSLTLEGGRWVVRDLGSSNHTFVNGSRVSEHVLENGDVIKFGGTTIEYRDDGTPGDDAPDGPMSAITSTIVRSVADITRELGFGPLAAGEPLARPRKAWASTVLTEAQRRADLLATLLQVGNALATSHDVDETLQTAMRLVFDVVDADRGVLLVVDDGNRTVPRVGWDRARGGPVPPGSIALSNSILRQAIDEKVAIFACDAQADARFASRPSVAGMKIRGAACVPLWEPDGVRGAIYLDSLVAPGALVERDLDLLAAIGNLVAARIRQERLEARLRREEVLRSNLARYHSPDVVEMLVRQDHDVVLEVAERDVTVLFVDVVGSTAIAERLGPAATADLLNEFFDIATTAIFEHGGSVNKFMGDEVLALYNAPLDLPDHAARAVDTAVDLLDRLRSYNAAHHDRELHVHIGINTGLVMAGNVGTARRMEYTVLGDAVNVASRLCKVLPPDRIAVGGETWARIEGRPRYRVREHGQVVIRGRNQSAECLEFLQ